MWTMVTVSVGLLLSAATGVGEARRLAERGVIVATVPADDGSRWIHANGALYEARTEAPTAIADPDHHALNATTIGAHVRSAVAVPALLAILVLIPAVALGLRRRTSTKHRRQESSVEASELRQAIAMVR